MSQNCQTGRLSLDEYLFPGRAGLAPGKRLFESRHDLPYCPRGGYWTGHHLKTAPK